MNLYSKETQTHFCHNGRPGTNLLFFPFIWNSQPSPYSVVAKGLKNIMIKKVRPCAKVKENLTKDLVKILTGSLEKKGEPVMFSPSETNLSINHSTRQMSRKPNMRNFSIKTVQRLTMTSFGPIPTNPHLEGENVF